MVLDVSELSTMDATAQAELVRRKELTPRELVDAAIARIERVNPTLNAVIIPFTRTRAGLPLRLIYRPDPFVECRSCSRTSAPCRKANRTTWEIGPCVRPASGHQSILR